MGDSASSFENTAPDVERYRTLLAINNAIISNLTQEVLFRAIAGALRRVVPFDRTAIFLHDPLRDVLRLFVLESTLTSKYFVVGLEMPPGASHVGRVFREGQPFLRRDLAQEREYDMELWALEDGVRSYVIVPLVARGRTLGVLAVASTKPDQYSEADAAFLQEAATQVALAVENMKAYEEIATLNTRLIASAERDRALLEVSNAIVANLSREALFQAMAGALRRMVSFDRIAVFLHDPVKDLLRIVWVESSLPSPTFQAGRETPLEQTPVGTVFRTQQPLVRADLETEREYPTEDRALADGVRSMVIVPLVVRGQSIGALTVSSVTPQHYAQADAAFLQEVGNQVTLATEHMKAYEEIRQEMARRRRAEEMLRTLVEGTASVTGEGFFNSLVRHLSAALEMPYAFVTEAVGQNRARTLAFWKRDNFAENFEYDVTDTPCLEVLRGDPKRYLEGVQALFPKDQDLESLGAESYLGIPVVDSSGHVVGHLAILDDKPMEDDPGALAVLKVFAARAGAELKRLQAERELQTALAELERLKDRLHVENVYLQEEIGREHNFVEMVGSSPALLAVIRKVEQVAPTDSTVLISGETGTGKELVARAMHHRSGRRERPLVKVNCSAISAGLVESELFGHVRGAFTGALERRLGRFEVADRGTIFLDEVGDLPLETQVKLLRVLQEREFEPVGSSRTMQVDVRVIAATNRDLLEAVRAGRFRADLYYRLNVFPIEVPALRERREDIPQLVMFFLARLARRFGKSVTSVSPETMERLTRYPWPGNIRELQNVIERAVVLALGSVLELGDALLPVVARVTPGPEAPVPTPATTGEAGLSTMVEMERAHVVAVLERTAWVVDGPKGAARILGLHPNTLRSRMVKLGIRRPRHDRS